jgi:hypothetical protein
MNAIAKCPNPISNPLNLLYKKVYIFLFIEKMQKNIKYKIRNNFEAQEDTIQDLTVLSTEFFRRCKTHIPSVIILPTESKTEMIRR